MNKAIRETFVATATENRIRLWEHKDNQPSNATIPPYGDEYGEIQQHLYVWQRPGVIAKEPEKTLPFGRKSGAEPGWLPDDELTRRWLQYVEEYRSECDAAEQEELPNDGGGREATS